MKLWLEPCTRSARLFLRRLDRLIRSDDEQLADDPLGPRQLFIAIGVMGGFYGLCMGVFAALRGSQATGWQMVASSLKVPLLFILTLCVTFPSAYVLAALSRSKLRFRETLVLLMRSIAVGLLLLASFGPITVFFTLSTKSYPFMVLLNVAMFAVSAAAGVQILLRVLRWKYQRRTEPFAQDRARSVLRLWVGLYGVVGAQMAWILRPFIGSPDLPFTLFRERESNFFLGVLKSIRLLFS